MGKGVRDRLRAHFLANIGRVMNSSELREVAGGTTDLAQRVQELRTEEGYQILKHNNDSKLKRGEYLLPIATPLPAFVNEISKEIQAIVLDHNDFTCQMCGTPAGEVDPYNSSRMTRLHFDYIIDKSHGGLDEVDNLRAVCSICKDGVPNLKIDRPSAITLLTQIRRATGTDQLEVLKWLARRFPQQLKELGQSGRGHA